MTMEASAYSRAVEKGAVTEAAKYKALAESTLDLVAIIDADGVFRYVNHAAQRYGSPPEELVSRSVVDRVETPYRQQFREAMDRALASPNIPVSVPYIVLRFGEGEDSEMHAEILLTAMPEALGIDGIVLSARDITELVRMEHEMHLANVRLRFEASTDPLTGLYNRRRGIEVLDNELFRVRHLKQDLSLIMMDIDFFKNVNDTHGHGAGDAVLVELAARLKRKCRRNDAIVRWGGEELLIICPHTSTAEIAAAADRFREAIVEEPVRLPNGEPIVVTASLGTASTDAFPRRSGKELIEIADKALYRAKCDGRNRVHNSSREADPAF